MNCRTLCSLGFAVLLSAAAAPAFAQEQSNPPAPSADSAAPGASQATAPAPSSSGSGATDTATSATPPTPAKRVWTNDDIGGLHRNSSISTFSGSTGKAAKTNEKQAAHPKNKDAKRYEDQITALRAKLPGIDDKIVQLQAVLNGDTVQATRTMGGNRIDDWHEELVNLQKQRDDIETKVSSLQDEARHNGVPENQIPQ